MKGLLFIFLFLRSFSSFSCPPSLGSINSDCLVEYNALEDQIIKKITLFGNDGSLREIYLGYYNYVEDTGFCNHNFIAFYNNLEEKDPEYGTYEYKPVFRYFNYYRGEFLIKPTEMLNAYQPNIKANKSFKLKDDSQSYKCRQRKEFEYSIAADLQKKCPQNYSKAFVSSMVIPRKNYPFCEYNIFTMNKVEYPDKETEVIFHHYQLDETGQLLFSPMPIEIHAKKIIFKK